MRALGYTRVSTEDQAVSGLGLEAQRSQIARAVLQRDWQLLDIAADEGFSGKSLERPGLHSALHRIAAGDADALIVAKLDRLTRSVADFVMLFDWFTREARADLLILDPNVDTSTASGKMMAVVFAAFAEMERDMIAERTRSALQARRAQGKPISLPTVSDDPQLSQHIRDLRDAGDSLQQICDHLNSIGAPTLRGAALWRPSAIQTVLGYKRRPSSRRLVALPKVSG